MSRQVSPSNLEAHGIVTVRRVWKVSGATPYRARHPVVHSEGKRRGPQGAMSDADPVTEIRAVLKASPFHGEGYRKVRARLRFAGVRTSKRRVLRLMRENGLPAPHRAGRPRGPRSHA